MKNKLTPLSLVFAAFLLLFTACQTGKDTTTSGQSSDPKATKVGDTKIQATTVKTSVEETSDGTTTTTKPSGDQATTTQPSPPPTSNPSTDNNDKETTTDTKEETETTTNDNTSTNDSTEPTNTTENMDNDQPSLAFLLKKDGVTYMELLDETDVLDKRVEKLTGKRFLDVTGPVLAMDEKFQVIDDLWVSVIGEVKHEGIKHESIIVVDIPNERVFAALWEGIDKNAVLKFVEAEEKFWPPPFRQWVENSN